MLEGSKILIVDDNEYILNSLKMLLSGEFETVQTVKNPNQIPSLVGSGSFDIILLDMNFTAGINTGNEGFYWLSRILELDPDAVVILITAYGDVELAVRAIKEGASDFVLKPWEPDKLISTLLSGFRLREARKKASSLESRQTQLTQDFSRIREYVHMVSPAMKALYETLNKVAATDANVLILGENGTGKEVIARELHQKSSRKKEIFMAVDLGSLSENLFESELFGHTKGAYTDARAERQGRFEIADKGTLFLDEIGNLPMPLQSKLLTVLERREVTKLGSNISIPVNIRLISATNRNLHEMVQENMFREDLLYRLNTVEIHIPPLRERSEDIALLADAFMKNFSRKYSKPDLRLSTRAVDALQNHPWPGNIRELKHVLENAVIMSDGNTIKPENLRLGGPSKKQESPMESMNLAEMEKMVIEMALKKSRGNMTTASKDLGISRATLYAKIQKYGI